MKIPRPGSDPAAIAEFVDALVRESEGHQRRVDWLCEVDRDMELYLGDHWETAAPADKIRIVLNRIGNCIISIVAIQAGDPPQLTFTPRETGEPPVVYLNTQLPESAAIAQQLLALGAVQDPTLPLPQPVAQMLKEQIDLSEMIELQAAAAGQPKPPGLLPRELLVEVTDQTTADALQTLVDAAWEESDGQRIFSENVLYKNIHGWQPTHYRFDFTEKRHVLENAHPKQVFPDNLRTDVSRWAYAVYDDPMSADEAKCEFGPEHHDAIDDNANEGHPTWPGSRQYDVAAIFDEHFEREMVVVRRAWVRHQPYPRDPDDAFERGLVDVRELPDGEPVSLVGGGGECPGCGAIGMDQLMAEGGLACPLCGAEFLQTPTRTAYFHVGTETEITPWVPAAAEELGAEAGAQEIHPLWPVRYGIREIVVLGTESIIDRECPYADIPVPANVNTPIPFSPYGQGEPKRLEGLQLAINQILSDLVTHHRYNAFPPELCPEDVIARLGPALKKARAKPGSRISVPKDLLAQVGGDIKKLIATLDPPSLPADFWRLLDLLISLIDREGNQADVAQGDAAPGWSGEAIASLQNAHNQVVRAKSMFTEFWLKRLARLIVHSEVRHKEAKDWMKSLSRYPVQAVQAMKDRAKGLDVDISVQISSGSGAAKQSETNNLVMARQAGVPVSVPTLMERLSLDPDAEQQKEANWMRKQAMLMGAGGGADPQAQGPQRQQQQQQPGAGGGGQKQQGQGKPEVQGK